MKKIINIIITEITKAIEIRNEIKSFIKLIFEESWGVCAIFFGPFK